MTEPFNITNITSNFSLYYILIFKIQNYFSLVFLAGDFSSGFASAITTPFDVIKTRIATGLLAPRSPVLLKTTTPLCHNYQLINYTTLHNNNKMFYVCVYSTTSGIDPFS